MTERSSAPTTPPSLDEQLEIPEVPLAQGLDASLNVADSLSESDLERAMAAGDDETRNANSSSIRKLTNDDPPTWMQTSRFTTPMWQHLERSPGSTMNQTNEIRENAGVETRGDVDHLEAFVSLLGSGSASQRTRRPSSRSMLEFVEQPHVAAVPFPVATAAADSFFPTPASSYTLSTPGRSNTYEQHHPQPCNCTQELANCVSEVRATDKTDISVRLDANLYGYDKPLSSVTSALRCVACSADAQILLLATMIMTIVVRWASALIQPAITTAPFRVQYGEFGEFFASEDASDIVRIVLTGHVFANVKETIGLLQQRATSLNDESPETKLLRCQVDGLVASFAASKAQFKLQ